MTQQQRGRRDKRASSTLFLVFDLWWAFLPMLLVGVLAAWHLAVVATTPAVMDDVKAPLLLLRGALRGGEAVPTSTIVVLVLIVAAFIGALVGLTFMVTRFRLRRPGKGMATKDQIRQAFSARAVLDSKRDGRLWPEDSTVPEAERTFCVGTTATGTGKLDVHFGQEQHLGVLAPTGRGKTYRVLSRAALNAPGALIVTSTKADLLDVIAEKRATKGRVWVFDLLDLVSWPERMTWDVLRGCQDSAIARARASQLVQGGKKKNAHTAGGGDSNAEFFQGRARTVLQAYLHAAALSGEHTIADVLSWAANLENDNTAQKILRDHPDADPLLRERLVSAVTGASDTVSSIRQTLDDSLDALSLSRINRQFMAVEGRPTFDPDAFVRSTDTLAIIADDNDPTDVTHLVALLVDAVFLSAKRAARRTASGRLSPPLRAVLDEVANICSLPTFPAMLSDLRGYGVQIIYGLQGRAQTQRVWGKEGAQMIVDNSAGQLVLGGIKDADQLEDLSKLAGMVDVASVSTQVRDHGMHRGNQTLAEQEKRVLRPEEISRLSTEEGLLVTGDVPPLVVHLPGWTALPDGTQLKAAAARTAHKRVKAAEAARK